MGFQSWKDSPNGKIQRFDIFEAKNYLMEDELSEMAKIVNAYLDIAELRAEEHVPMTMEDGRNSLEEFYSYLKKIF